MQQIYFSKAQCIKLWSRIKTLLIVCVKDGNFWHFLALFWSFNDWRKLTTLQREIISINLYLTVGSKTPVWYISFSVPKNLYDDKIPSSIYLNEVCVHPSKGKGHLRSPFDIKTGSIADQQMPQKLLPNK